jgi:prolyl-tRNA editing enzyme YbaK/EbsC (Cys-tRNA(Pro) deacylase)
VLKGFGSSVKISLLPESAATAIEAATALGVDVNRIGKSIVFGSPGSGVVGVLGGDRKVDIDAFRLVTGAASLRKLRAEEVKDLTGFPIGGVSPIGLPANIPVFVDLEFSKQGWCYVAAGHPHAVARIDIEELLRLSRATLAGFSV